MGKIISPSNVEAATRRNLLALQALVVSLRAELDAAVADVGTLQTDVGTLQTDVDNLQFSGRAGSYAPSVTNITLGTGGSASGEYVFTGNGSASPATGELVVWFDVTLGTGGTLSGVPSISLPTEFTADSSFATTVPLGNCFFIDASSTDFLGLCRRGGAGIQFYQQTVSGTGLVYTNPSSTVPFTWTSGDQIVGKAIIRGTWT